ncbi:hypothetical protein LWI29_024406 [Acer saccharum]|uniref:Methyltransferase n=1 Tax=Acer saccharum TaxID=4024 RepID=A0AA39VW34_ACESA|nr:hypothetical protein LWI29_024406 [Acer saccharum]
MAIENIFKERKYPFILALSVLLITVAVFVLTTTSNPISSVFFYQQQSTRNGTVSRTANATAIASTPSPTQNNNTPSPDNSNNNTPSPSDNNNNKGSGGGGENNDSSDSGDNNDSSSGGNNDNNNNTPSPSDNNNNNSDGGGGGDNNKNTPSPSDNNNNNSGNNDNNGNDDKNDSSSGGDNNGSGDNSGSSGGEDNDGSSDGGNNNVSGGRGDNNDDSSGGGDNSSSSSDNNANNNTTSVVGSDPNSDDNDTNNGSDSNNNNDTSVAWSDSETDPMKWKVCRWPTAADYIPCLDNKDAIKKLKSRKHMEHRERHCPNPPPRCLVPLPDNYKVPIPWPKSRDMIWYDNVPHPKLVEYKKEQNWVRKSGEYFVFPGGGTQFKQGVASYLDFIQRTFPPIIWGRDVRVVLDVGCGVASFGGYLLDKNVVTMSLAPKDEHEAQIQFALERGIPAVLSVIGTQKLPFPDDSYDLIHCARCRVHWDADGGKPLLELNRILRPGGFFIWSATPVYKKDERHRNTWESMSNLTASICWKAVARAVDSSKIGLVVYQKPMSYSCYKIREANDPPLCDTKLTYNSSWYEPLMRCVSELPLDRGDTVIGWPKSWPERLQVPSAIQERRVGIAFEDHNNYWSGIVSSIYLEGLSINWSKVRNVMDMNASYGGFAAALIDKPLWVMNVIPIDAKDALPILFDRGLFGIYHDWCESFSTYPRTYDLLHSSYLLTTVSQRCDIKDVVVEIDRILRPEGYLVVQDTMETINKISPILRSLHWSLKLYQNQFLVGIKGFWRP